jgi:hypothetical protein
MYASSQTLGTSSNDSGFNPQTSFNNSNRNNKFNFSIIFSFEQSWKFFCYIDCFIWTAWVSF